ncbi:MAG TPA: PEGA domain-containing protein [Candidatus Ratteibacteria bacterium]|nr:PEGA domain-containing protein [Candidatus Ratteibacteria bacterium]
MKVVEKALLLGFIVCFFYAVNLFAQEGYLRVISNPDGADVEVAGKNIGKTPVLSVLKPGKYTYKVSLTGYETLSGTTEVVENEVTRLNLTLVKQVQKTPSKPTLTKSASAKGGLTILTDWQDVSIYLNGHKVNETPPVTLKDVPAGLNSVILVSGDYADSFRILVQQGKTSVLKKNFQEDKNKYEAQATVTETTVVETSTLVKSMLPAKIIVSLTTSVSTESTDSKKQDASILGESDSVEVSFRYRKAGETDWNEKTLVSGTKVEESFEIGKGTYEIQLIAVHYKVPTGLLNVLLSKKEKIREYKESISKEIQPDTKYKYTISYDGKSFGYKLEEMKLNTSIK